MGNVVEMKAKETTQVVTNMNKRKPVFDLVMKNVRTIGSKTYVYVPLDLLIVDPAFQRNAKAAKSKVKKLVDNWNPHKMDSLRIVPHPESFEFSVVDGGHRLEALKTLGAEGVECEVILGLSENPQERLIQEAFIFATQGDEEHKVAPVDKHRANILRGVEENVILDKVMKKYDIPLKSHSARGRVRPKQLAGFTIALNIAKVHGESLLSDTIYTICESRWNIATHGLSALTLHSIASVLKFHPEHKNAVIAELINFCTPIQPDQFYAMAHAKYPERKEKERLVLFLEDYVVEKLGINRVYTGGSTSIKVVA